MFYATTIFSISRNIPTNTKMISLNGVPDPLLMAQRFSKKTCFYIIQIFSKWYQALWMKYSQDTPFYVDLDQFLWKSYPFLCLISNNKIPSIRNKKGNHSCSLFLKVSYFNNHQTDWNQSLDSSLSNDCKNKKLWVTNQVYDGRYRKSNAVRQDYI